MRKALANLGFLFQIIGILTILPILYAFFLNETESALGLLVTSLAFFTLGFPLNALCERKEMNLKESCKLLVLFFFLTPLINSIPYIYLRIFDGPFLEILVNSYFESMAGITTTGLTLIENIHTLPKSFLLARTFGQWIGGIGIVFILLTFFYPSESLFHYVKVLGVERFAPTLKSSFMVVMLIYIFYTLLFSSILIVMGISPFESFQTILTTISTTGLSVLNIANLPFLAMAVLLVLTLLSALSFSIHFNLLLLQFKKIITKEMVAFFILLLILFYLFWKTSGFSPFLSFFHVAEFSSSIGFGTIDFSKLSNTAKLILVAAMLIGPCSFSVGGGIKVWRLMILGKLLGNTPKFFLGEDVEIKIGEKSLKGSDIVIHLLVIISFLSLLLLGSTILSYYGYDFVDAMVEAASALSTTGNTPLPKSSFVNLSLVPKILLISLMFLGRIEILPLFIAFLPSKEVKKPESVNTTEEKEKVITGEDITFKPPVSP